MKQVTRFRLVGRKVPAAFGRLCVETIIVRRLGLKSMPAAFGRLCVETD